MWRHLRVCLLQQPHTALPKILQRLDTPALLPSTVPCAAIQCRFAWRTGVPSLPQNRTQGTRKVFPEWARRQLTFLCPCRFPYRMYFCIATVLSLSTTEKGPHLMRALRNNEIVLLTNLRLKLSPNQVRKDFRLRHQRSIRSMHEYGKSRERVLRSHVPCLIRCP